MRVRRSGFVIGAAAFCTLVPLAARGAKEPADEEDPKVHVHGANGITVIPEGRPLEWTMKVLDGADFRLSRYRGKVVFLNVFATWCGPCRREQPALTAF